MFGIIFKLLKLLAVSAEYGLLLLIVSLITLYKYDGFDCWHICVLSRLKQIDFFCLLWNIQQWLDKQIQLPSLCRHSWYMQNWIQPHASIFKCHMTEVHPNGLKELPFNGLFRSEEHTSELQSR